MLREHRGIGQLQRRLAVDERRRRGIELRGRAAIQCRRCGGRCAPSPEVRARLDASEKALLSALLTGAEARAATEQIVAPRWSAALATRVRTRCQRDLPFVRAHLWEAVLEGRLELRLAPPPVCDLCAQRPLADQRPLQASWRRVVEDTTKISPLTALTLFGGVAVLRRERTVETLAALYFLCGECNRELRRLFRTYKGYPADVGFALDELRQL